MTDTTIATKGTYIDLASLSATICAELAAGLADAQGIKAKYKISDGDWDVLKRSPTFRGMLKEAIQEWKGDLNAGKRIVKKAEIMLEDSLPVLYDIAHDGESPRQQRIDSVKTMKDLARPNGGKDAAAGLVGGAQINIIIDTGKEEKTITIDGTAIPQQLEEAA